MFNFGIEFILFLSYKLCSIYFYQEFFILIFFSLKIYLCSVIMADVEELILATFKYDSFWSNFKNENKKNMEEQSKKIVKIDEYVLSFHVLI